MYLNSKSFYLEKPGDSGSTGDSSSNTGTGDTGSSTPVLKFSYTISSLRSCYNSGGLYLGENEYGYYKVYMYSDKTYHIELSEVSSNGDHDIYIYRGGLDGTLVERHNSYGGEDFYFTPPSTGYYYIVIKTYNDKAGYFTLKICPSESDTETISGSNSGSDSYQETSTREYSLYEAVSYGYVEVYITGTGKYYGKSMYIKIISKVSYNLKITIEQGRILVPKTEYSDYQRMIIAKEETVYLYGESDYEYLYVYAFCIDPFKEIPETTTYYDVGSMASPNIVRLLSKIEEKDMLNDWNAQLAVWLATNPSQKDEIIDKYVMGTYNELEKEYGTQYAARAILEEVIEPTNELLKESSQSIDLDYYVNVLRNEAYTTTSRQGISSAKVHVVIGIFIMFLILAGIAIVIYLGVHKSTGNI